mgnify:FL=1
MALASILMGFVAYGLGLLLADMLATAGLRYLALAILIVASCGIYFAACLLLGAFTKQGLRNFVKR